MNTKYQIEGYSHGIQISTLPKTKWRTIYVEFKCSHYQQPNRRSFSRNSNFHTTKYQQRVILTEFKFPHYQIPNRSLFLAEFKTSHHQILNRRLFLRNSKYHSTKYQINGYFRGIQISTLPNTSQRVIFADLKFPHILTIQPNDR